MRTGLLKIRVRLVATIAASGLVCAAAAGMMSGTVASAAVLHTGAKAGAMGVSHTSKHHVSPFGVGATRAVRHITRHAAAPRVGTSTVTEWVSNTVPVGHNTGCASPGFATISSALAAAPSGATVKVCAGTYGEQLVITQSVILSAHGAVTVTGPAAPPSTTSCDADGGSQPNQDVVDICGAGTVKITGFTFQGSWPSNVCYDSIYGVAVLGGAALTMSNSTVENIGGDPQTDGCQGGVGIEVGEATSATTADAGTATLTNVNVSNYQKNGITVDGAGSNAIITGATVTGTGQTPATAQNGIQISDGATATIKNSQVTGDECNDTAGGCGPNGFSDTQAAGILLFDAGKTSVSGTTVSSCDLGVYNLEDFAWSFYTPPAHFVAASDFLFGLGLNNRYENAWFDEGKTTLSSSTLSGGEVGIEEAQGSYQTTPAIGTAKSDTITGTSEDAILLASDQTAGDPAPKLTATLSSFDSTNAGGVANQSTSVLGVTDDWWGDATGPSDWSFGSGSSVSSDVNFFPWYTDSGMTALETCATGSTETTTGNDVVLCAKAGVNALLANNGAGNVLLIGNKNNDQLNGSAGGETWIIGGVGGTNVINGHGGTGFIQERGNTNDTLINTGGYTVTAD
jgi:hypothetical protein